MNIPPQVIDGMSLWQFCAMVNGFNRFHSSEAEKPPYPSDEDYYEMMRREGFM